MLQWMMNWVSTNQGTYSKVVSVYYIHMIVESLYRVTELKELIHLKDETATPHG